MRGYPPLFHTKALTILTWKRKSTGPLSTAQRLLQTSDRAPALRCRISPNLSDRDKSRRIMLDMMRIVQTDNDWLDKA